ncbi:MAG: lamin tail domain-containing protein [Gaiellaceae bacterium]
MFVRRSWAALAVTLSVVVLAPATANAAAGDLFFSEYVEGSSNNKALELYNPGSTDVSLAAQAYGIQMYFNGSTGVGLTLNLTGVVPAHGTYVIAHAQADPAIIAVAQNSSSSAGWFNGNDAVALRKGNDTVDVIGQIGNNPGTEWGTGLTSTADNTIRRKQAITAGDANGSDVFDPAVEWEGFANNTFGGLGSHTVGTDEPIAIACGGALTTLEGFGAARNVTATDADSTVTSLTLDSVAPAPAAGGIARTAFTPATADGATATATITVDPATPVGVYTVTMAAANDDTAPQAATCAFTVTVTDVKAIGELQGAVLDTDNPLTHRSPFPNNTVVFTHGVVTQKLVNRTSAGVTQFAIFLQSTESTDDDNALSSDGIYVFMNRFPDLLRDDGVPGNYVPKVGDEIVVRASVSEFFNMTQLSSARLQRVVSTLNAAPTPFDLNLPSGLNEANITWERHEGEQARVVKDSIATDGLDHFAGSEDGEIWLARPDTAIAQRPNPFERRVFRDAHPLDDVSNVLFDNGNGYRMLIGSHGVKATLSDPLALLTPSRTFDTLKNDLVGGVYFGFNKYQVMPAEQPVFEHGVDPSTNAPPQAFDRGGEYSIADYNVENLYDRRDDPNDGCDFPGNAGCPGVSPPFNYVPETQAQYDAHLADLAGQIRGDLHSPDLLLIQEAEDQDICTVSGGALVCGTADNRDGKPDTLQELALTIEQQGGPDYDAAFDRDGRDDRGIVAAFMYRTDRVELLPADPSHPVLGGDPEVDYRSAALGYNTDVQNPKALNAVLPADVDLSTGRDGDNVFTRAPQVGLFRVWRTAKDASVFTDVLAISNHFSSTPDARVGQRTEQANYLAAIVNAAPEERIDAGGDFNTFPRPDDALNRTTDPHQLAALYDDAGLANLYDRLVDEVPASAYSYVFVGMAQTLDGQFVSDTLSDELGQARIAHVNADWPADAPGDGARGASDHDPLVARFDADVTLDRLVALFEYFNANGAIKGGNTYEQLKAHLDQAAAKDETYRSQLQAFANQTAGKAPRFVTQEAADALVSETNRLIGG